MKILLIGTLPPYRGGLGHFNVTLLNYLSESNQVSGINFTTQYPQFLFPGKTQYDENGTEPKFPVKRLFSSINPISWFKTAAEIRRQNPDLIIFRYWMPFFAPAYGVLLRIVGRRSKAKILAICDNIIPHERHWFDIPFTRYFFNKVNYFLVMSREVENDLLRLYPSAQYSYSPHPIYDIFGKSLEKSVARKKLGIDREKVILYFGFIRQYKGLDILLNAAKELSSELEDFVVLAAGECYEDPESYFSLIKENNIENLVDLRMEFIPDDDIKLYFSAADVVVLPYRSATQSGIVQIAYHFNRPVIVSDVGGLPEIVPDGEVGFVTKPAPNEIAAAVKRFYNEGKEEEFSNSIKSFKEKFSWPSFVKNITGFMV